MHAWEVAVVDVAMRDVRAMTVLIVDPLLPAPVRVDSNEIVNIGMLISSRASRVKLARGSEVVLADGYVFATPRDFEGARIAMVESAFFDLVGLRLVIEGIRTSRSKKLEVAPQKNTEAYLLHERDEVL